VAALFLRLGLIAFGGPAAHIALFHSETVRRRKWLDDHRFLDILGATNLIPGPNSTETAMHLGLIRGGRIGLVLAGACFILPAMLIVLLLSHLYVRFGGTPEAAHFLYGVKPIMVVIIVQALVVLGRKAILGPLTAIVGASVITASSLGVNEIALLFLGGLFVMLVKNRRRIGRGGAGLLAPLMALSLPAAAAKPVSLPLLFDAIAIGQITPGPVLTTATCVGYILGGLPAALLATAGIFLPSFLFVLLSSPFLPRMRRSAWAGTLLDGVNVSALGLMAAVTWRLGRASFIDGPALLIGLLAALLLFRFRVNTTWLVLGGAVAGFLRGALLGPS
jgi:chromate transporter